MQLGAPNYLQRVFILTEGDLKIGLGHAARCGALYDAFVDSAIDAELLICGDSSVSKVLEDRNWQLHDWISTPPDWKTSEFSNGGNMVFIDSYRAPDATLDQYSRRYRNVVLLDDHAIRRSFRGSIVTPVNFAGFLSFPLDPNVHRIIGPDYILLRRPFWNAKAKTIRAEIQSVFVSLGGWGAKDLLLSVIDVIRSELPGTEITVVSGRQSNDGQNARPPLLRDVHTKSDMAACHIHSVMMQSDIAIAGGGQTLYELASLGVPSIAISIADNQELAIRAFAQSGYLLEPLSSQNDDLSTSIRRQLQLLRDPNTRQKLSKIGQSIVDGKGAQRLAHALIQNQAISNG